MMKDHLVPYRHFESEPEAAELAERLQQLTRDNADTLRARNIGGPIVRYAGELTEAIAHVHKSQESEDPEHYAILNNSGTIVGSASVYRALGLEKLRLPLPPLMLPRQLKPTYDCATPNITAWIDEGESTALLSNTYKHLLEQHREAKTIRRDRRNEFAWTVEPTKSPTHIHEAIATSGLRLISSRRYHDQESRRRIPPRTTLYADVSYRWLKTKDIEKQLSCGERSDWYGRLSEKRNFKYMS